MPAALRWDFILLGDGRAKEEKAGNRAALVYTTPVQISVGHQIQTPNLIYLREKSNRGEV